MDTIRYVLGVLLVVGLPPAVVFWLLIHPLAAFWRKLGPWVSYTFLTGVCVALGGVGYYVRDRLLGPNMGTNWVLIPPGVFLYGLSAWLSVLTRRQLNMRTFAGIPEIAGRDSGGTLLQEGIYGVVRHPRYLSVIIGTVGFSMFVNYLGAYLLVLVSVLLLLLVILLEESELSRRFGAEYDTYRSRVPALIPRSLSR